MRRAMICVSVMLAFVQVWPMIFGNRSVVDVASPGARAAVVIAVPPRAVRPTVKLAHVVPAKASAPSSCFARYRARYAACAKGDLACGTTASNQWDLCEATGFWPS